MKPKKGLNFFLLVIAIITGSKLYQHTDFHNWKFEKPALDTVYLLTFIVSIIVLIRDALRKS